MSARGPYRRDSQQFKMQLRTDMRDGKLGRREAQKTDVAARLPRFIEYV